jgi:hypothetical protein
MHVKVALLMIFSLLLTGCSSTDESGSSEVKTIEDISWINSCESDYKSSECEISILEMLQKQQSVGLYAVLEPFNDPETSPECLADPESNACDGTRFILNSTMTDLTCEEVEAFGFGDFCYAKIILWNKGDAPLDDFFEASLHDKEGRKFAADVEGEFRFGLMSAEFSDDFKINLNPGKFEFVHFGFSIPDKNLIFTSLNIDGYESSFRIPLCLKTRGDGSDYDRDKIQVFENARLLNSCTFNWDSFAYENRQQGN